MMFPKDILLLIPQRPPFVMVDQLLHSDESTTQTSFYIPRENVFITNGEFSEAGLMENIAQTAAARAGYTSYIENKPAAVGYIGAVKDFEVFDLPLVNDELLTTINIADQVFDVTIITGKVWCRDKLMARCEMKIFIGK